MVLEVPEMVFGTVLLAELGDKAQLATPLFASKPGTGAPTVFLGASQAFVAASAIAAGAQLSNFVDPSVLSYVAGAGFIAIGVRTILQADAQ